MKKSFRRINNVIILVMLLSWIVTFICYTIAMYNIYASDFEPAFYIFYTLVFSGIGICIFASSVISIWVNRKMHGWKKK